MFVKQGLGGIAERQTLPKSYKGQSNMASHDLSHPEETRHI